MADLQLLDARGCLTSAGWRVLNESPAGRVPEEIAQHVAGCLRCQEQLLGGSASGAQRRNRTIHQEIQRIRRRFIWIGGGFVLLLILLGMLTLLLNR